MTPTRPESGYITQHSCVENVEKQFDGWLRWISAFRLIVVNNVQQGESVALVITGFWPLTCPERHEEALRVMFHDLRKKSRFHSCWFIATEISSFAITSSATCWEHWEIKANLCPHWPTALWSLLWRLEQRSGISSCLCNNRPSIVAECMQYFRI